MPVKKKRSFFAVVRLVLIIVFAAVFVFCGAMLVLNIAQRRKGAQIYEELEETFNNSGFDHKKFVNSLTFREDNAPLSPQSEQTDDVDEAGGMTEEQAQILGQMREGLSALREINPDIYAWIYVPGTDIDYPVVRGDDNSHYLNYAYNGTYSPLGAIFADYRCPDGIEENVNTVFYGHNLLTGGSDMFHDIEMFLTEEFFDSALIYVYTFDGIYVYQPFAVYQARYDYNYFEVNFDSAEEFVDFAVRMKENSRIDNDTVLEPGDSMITLSTCTNIEYFTRYALHAKLIYRIED